MSYSHDFSEQWRNAADYTNRLLAGTRLEELPIQRPSRGFDLTLNLKAAKELGITVPREILVLARDVIE
jgi:putative ABC transport system substrate-binding protein